MTDPQLTTLLGPTDRRDSPRDLELCICGHARKEHLRGHQYCFRASCRFTCKAFESKNELTNTLNA